MIRRAERLRFLGGFYAFPGGQVDPDDYALASRLVPAAGGSGSRLPSPGEASDRLRLAAHQVAAIREVFEECGVLLAGPAGSEQEICGPRWDAHRRDLLLERRAFSEILEEEGRAPDVNALSFLDRWVTPASSPIRFDTRFYTAWMPGRVDPDPYEGEASWGGWVDPEAALRDADAGRMPMVLSTVACLVQLRSVAPGGPAKGGS